MKAYEKINDYILSKIEQGDLVWKQAWSTKQELPNNPKTGSSYSGINLLILSMASYGLVSRFLTYKQASSLGGQVKKGEKGLPVIYWSQYPEKDKETGEVKRNSKGKVIYIPFLKSYTVFHVSQIEGLHGDLYKVVAETYQNTDIPEIERFINHYKGLSNVKVSQGLACVYKPSDHEVIIPELKYFKSEHEYYASYFHELVHSTKKKLERKVTSTRKDYAFEELVAELGAAYLCARFKIDNHTLDNHAAYIGSWIKLLKKDNRAFIHASAQAVKAVSYMTEGFESNEIREVA